MSENVSESFNRLIWHDSKLRCLRILRKDDLDEVLLDVELRGVPGQELTPMTVVLENAVFFLSDIDLQGKTRVLRRHFKRQVRSRDRPDHQIAEGAIAVLARR